MYCQLQLFIISLLCFSFLTQDSTSEASATVTYAKIGGTAVLSCEVTLIGDLTLRTAEWIKLGPSDVIVADLTGANPVYAGRATVNSTGFLLLENVEQDDAGMYRCVPSLSDFTSPTRVETDLQIANPPDPPTVSYTGAAVYAGSDLTVTCQSNTGNPAPTLTWYQLTSGGGQQQVGTAGQGSSDLVFNPLTAENDGARFVCKATNQATEQPGVDDPFETITLLVYYPPDEPTVSYDGFPVVAGEAFSTTCTADTGNPPPTVSWYLRGSDQAVGTPGTGSSVLQISSLTKDDNGDGYVCVATNDATGDNPPSKDVTLVVHYPPQGISKSADKEEVEKGDDVTLTCNVTDGNPEVFQFSWTKMPGPLSPDAQGASTNQLHIVSLTKEDNGTYICTVGNGISPPGSAQHYLTVQYLDRLTIASNPSGSSQSSLTSTEGQNVSLECTVEAFPEARILWTRPDGSMLDATVLVLEHIIRTQAGTYNCTASNTIKGENRSEHASLDITVNYLPTITTITPDLTVDEFINVSLSCTADSNPPPTSFTWTYKGVSLQTTTSGDFTLTTSRAGITHDQAGVYRCTVGNGIQDSSSNVIRDTVITVEFPPKFPHQDVPYTAADGDTVNLTCSAIAEPAITVMRWIYNDQVLSTGGQFTVTQRPAGVSVLTIADVMEDNYGMYNCTAENAKGLRWSNITLETQAPPHAPTNLKVISKNQEGHVTVQWTAGFNGGLETTHIVDYRKDGDKDWTDGETVTQSLSENYMNYRVSLQLGSQGNFTIRLRTSNDSGSVPTVTVAVLIEGETVLLGKLTVNQDFHPDHNDLESQRSQEFIYVLLALLDEFMMLAIFPGYQGSRVVKLSPGSIVTDFEMTVATSEVQPVIDALQDQVGTGTLGNLSVHKELIIQIKSYAGGDNTTVIIIAAVGGTVLVAIIGVGVFIIRRRKSANGKAVENDSNNLQLDHMRGKSDDGYQSLRIAQRRTSDHTYQGLTARSKDESSADTAYEDVKVSSEFPRDRLEIKDQVGEGEFGEVYKAEAWDIRGIPGMTTLVVKTVKGITKDASAAFFKELSVLKLLGTHPNVVSFLGCCTDTEPFYLLLEYVSGGSLQSNLRTSRTQQTYGNLHGGSKSLSSRDLTKFAWDVAKGMTFLSSKKILHRDLATRNVLVSADRTCKVSDFGFSREGDEYERTAKTRLPIRWMAPESMFHRKYTTKTDVWAFGVLLWEIVTLGGTPYPGMSKREVMDGVQQGYRMDKPKHCDDKLYTLMLNCWNADPIRRPEFRKIQRTLDSLMETEHDYIDLASLDENTYTSLQTVSDEKY